MYISNKVAIIESDGGLSDAYKIFNIAKDTTQTLTF